MAVIGLDLGGTKLAGALFTAAGDASHRSAQALSGRAGAAVGAVVVDEARRLIELADADEVSGVGVAIPGIYRASSGTVWAPNIPGWDDYPLGDDLRSALPSSVVVRVDSDRACAILGETWRGAARGSRNAVFLVVGTGIGAGVLVEGRVLRGVGDAAGAVGWMALDRPFRADYVAGGCFEHHASGTGIAAAAGRLMAEDRAYDGVLRLPDPGQLTARDVFAAHDAGDAVAGRVLDEAVVWWGMAVANLVSVFNPDRIIFGGGVFGPATRFMERIHAEAVRWAQPLSMKEVTLVPSALGEDAVLYGAARLAVPPSHAEPVEGR